MYHLTTYNSIASEGLRLLEEAPYILNESNDPDGILLRSHKLDGLTIPSNLKGIARAGAGVNNIAVDRYSEAGVVVFNTPGANANAVKELVLAGMIMAARPIAEGLKWVETLEGEDIDVQVENGKKHFSGTELSGKTLGVIGLGAIGSLVANDAYRLGMEVIGYDPYVSVEIAWNISSRVKKAKSLEEVLKRADYVTLHIPATPDTEGMVNPDFIRKMKQGAVLLNFARGELVQKEALLEALNAKKLKKYVTDFAAKEFLKQKNIIVLPHLGASTKEAEVNCSVQAVKTLKYFLETGNIVDSVNFPSIDVPFQSAVRLMIVNRNVPNMVGQMSAVFANDFINIDNILNRSRGNYAYTIIDISETDDALLQEVLAKINAIDGILKTRVLRR